MKKLDVHLQTTDKEFSIIGTLAEKNHRLYFEYSADFLANPLWLSPFKLPPKPGLHEHRDLDFGPIFGLFEDSLPDGWGLLLMDRAFQKQGLNPARISILDRLAYLGTRTMGALTYHPAKDLLQESQEILDLQILANEVKKVWNGNVEEILPQLLKYGGSPGGARPKILAGIKNNEIITADALPEDFEPWIIKFSSPQESPDSGKIEYIYATMAQNAGLHMTETRLFKSSQDEHYFGIKRFDRKKNQRFHCHTFGNLIHSNFRIPNCDYSDLLKITKILTKNHQNVLSTYRQALFNICSHNRDDHVKNFSFIFEPDTAWSSTPVYDLTFCDGPGGEHSMTICGKGTDISKKDCLKLAENTGISPSIANDIIDEVSTAVSNWSKLAANFDINKKENIYIQKHIDSNLKRLC